MLYAGIAGLILLILLILSILTLPGRRIALYLLIVLHLRRLAHTMGTGQRTACAVCSEDHASGKQDCDQDHDDVLSRSIHNNF